MNRLELENLIQSQGFDLWGITPFSIPEMDKDNIGKFIQREFYGSMEWFPDRQNIRIHGENLGFKVESVLVLASIYKPTEESEGSMGEWKDKIARYAWGEDYHTVLKTKAKPILESLKKAYPGKKFRQGVDSLPVPEKILAREAGLGWIGKNTLLINPEIGSYFFLTVILCEVDIRASWNTDETLFGQKDRCGSCRACIDACPTQAIVTEYQLDSRKCISHHTIEYPGDEFPDGMETHGWVFGCDICQEVCPWNRIKAKKRNISTGIKEFSPLPIWKKSPHEIFHITKEEFENAFDNSPIRRTGLGRLRRNLKKLHGIGD